MEGKPDWLGIIPQCCDSAHRWALVTLQSNEKYRPSRQTSSLTNEACRPKIPLWYQEHGTEKRTRQMNQNRQTFIENTNELKNGRKIRLTGYHATVLRSSRQSSACHNAVKRKLLDITSNIIVDQPGISTNNITVIPRTRGQAKKQVFR